MLIGSEFIGEARVPVNLFLKPVEIAGHVNEHIELRRFMQVVGRIHMRSEFIPEVAMGGGMATGGGGGMGAGMAIAGGAMAGAMIGMEIAAHKRHHRF